MHGYRIIDLHTHFGTWQQYGMDDQIEGMLRAMDLGGVDKACIFNMFYTNASRGNDEVVKLMNQYPDRFIGFAFVTPHYPEEMQGELERAIDKLGLKGIKIYPPYFPKPVTDPVWEPIFEFANERELVIVSHTWGKDECCDPMLFVTIAEKFPKLKLVMGHSGGTLEGRQIAIRAAKACSRIYLEICSSLRDLGSIEELVEGAGEDQVVYGSDMSLMDPRIHVGRVLTAKISEDAKRKVLGENAIRILGPNFD